MFSSQSERLVDHSLKSSDSPQDHTVCVKKVHYFSCEFASKEQFLRRANYILIDNMVHVKNKNP